MNPNTKPQYTSVAFDQEAIDKTYKGVRLVTRAVATTLGPRGRNVLIDKGYETTIIHDGVNVSLAINPKDPYERNGANVIKEATQRQRDQVGDGTTVVAVLTQAILDEALKVTASGTNPMSLRAELETARDKTIKRIKELAIPIKSVEDLISVATISCQDKELGKMIGETINKLGDAGVLTVDESKATETVIDFQKGMQLDKGFSHKFFMTDPVRQLAIMEDCHVLVTDYPLIEFAPFAKFFEEVVLPQTKKILILSPEIGGDFLTIMVGAKANGNFMGLPVRAPGFGVNQQEILQDICAMTGATYITKETNMKFDDLTSDVLGHAGRVVSSQHSTLIEAGNGYKEDILARIQYIKAQMRNSDLSEYEQEQLKGRLAKLTSGVATIKVGGSTEVEMKERKERAIDAVCATNAAKQSGIVAGGETIYLLLHDTLNELILGEKILKRALLAPFTTLINNSGLDAGEMLATYHVLKKDVKNAENLGFDVIKNDFVNDLVKAEIIDPAMVASCAIDTAVSVATQLISMGCAVVIDNEEVS